VGLALASATVSELLVEPGIDARVPIVRRMLAAVGESLLCRLLLDLSLIVGVATFMVYLKLDSFGQDLGVYRTGGHAVIYNRPLYQPSFHSIHGLLFTYPPFAALLFAPLYKVSQHTAMSWWTMLTILGVGSLIVIAVKLAFKVALPRRWTPHLIVLGGLMASMIAPIKDCLTLGQIGVFLTLMCLADTALARTRWPRGVLIGFAAAVKMTPGLFVLYYVITGQWKAARNAVVTLAVCWGIAAVVLPSDTRDFFIRRMGFDASRVGDVSDHMNQSLNGLWHRLPLLAPGVWWVASSLLVGAFGMWRARRAYRTGDLLAASVLVGFVVLLVSPVSWMHHAAWLVPAVIVLASRGQLRYRIWTVALVILLFVPIVYINGRDPYTRGFLVETYVVVYLLIVAFLPVRSSTATVTRLNSVGAEAL
jgi:alpha-1,2-mannosyltransferase